MRQSDSTQSGLMIGSGIVAALLLFLLGVAAAQEKQVICGDEWVTFSLPGIPEGERQEVGLPMVNAPKETVLTLRKGDLRNLVFFPDTRGGEVVFRLETAHPEKRKVVYSALVTEAVYLDVRACLN